MEPKLFYLNDGERRYGDSAVAPYGRPHWEFQAVIRGEIAPLTTDGSRPSRARTLWVFENGHPHGWTARAGSAAEIIVFHLSAPEPVLRGLVSAEGGHMAVSLGNRDIEWLKLQRDSLRTDWARPTEMTSLKIAHLLTGLSLLVLERSGYQPAPDRANLDSERVARALYWYDQQVKENPGIDRVASAVGVSPVHLRRLFRKVRGESPKRAFQAIRLEHARSELRDPRVTVEAVAERYGFADASSFSRAYRRAYGQAPRR